MAKKKGKHDKALHWLRFLMAVFAMLIAAAHLPSAGSSSAPKPTATASNSLQTSQPQPGQHQFSFTFWFDVEIIAYTIIAIVYLLGLRRWYIPSAIFNAFNIGIYFLSGVMAIPGITTMPFGNRLSAFSYGSVTTLVLIISWIAALIISLILLKYDPGSELDALLKTRSSKG
jgi:hypothetical protein